MPVMVKRIVIGSPRPVMVSEADMDSGKVFMVFFMAVLSVKAPSGKRIFRKKKKDYRYDKADSFHHVSPFGFAVFDAESVEK